MDEYKPLVVGAIQLAVEAKLLESNESRTFALGGEGGLGAGAYTRPQFIST